LEEMEKIQKILTGELEEAGYVLVLGGYEREGHVIIKGDVYEGGVLALRGLFTIKTERYQRMTQQRSVACPECKITLNIPKDQDKFQCPQCKKEWTLKLSEEEKKFEEFKAWSVGFAFWAEEKSLREKVKEFFEGIPETIREKPETLTGSSGLIGWILRLLGR